MCFFQAEHLSLLAGCARSKPQYPAVLQNLKLDRDWDGLPALDLWEEYRITNPWGSRKLLAKSQIQTQTKEKRDVHQLSHVDYVTTNANSSQGEHQLYTFEDNEAVIKMIMKGRGPTMRHVSRTHSFALDWLFDRINMDRKIQTKYVDTKNQLGRYPDEG